MADNKNATDKLHSQINPYFRSKVNPNWKALISAIGESDQSIADLVEEVRKQFFVQTASRPYLDRLGANMKVTRPKVVGMDDITLRKYIPVLAYQPKQVKQTIDKLLDIFFFHEATTAFIESSGVEPFLLEDGWELIFNVDGEEEKILFSSSDFSDISAATAEEVAAAFNRQAKRSFAVSFDDRIAQQKKVRIFTKTIGAKGSIEMLGGRSNISLQFTGFLNSSGNGPDTVWSISKVGDEVTVSYVSGTYPGLSSVQAGDTVIVDLPNNSGSFTITDVDLSNNTFSYINLFANPGVYSHSLITSSYVKFLRPTKSIVYSRNNRAVVWEVKPGEIIIEMPATPPVVRRQLKGSAHINGMVSTIATRISDNSIEIANADEWPEAGQFILEPKEEVICHIDIPSIDEMATTVINGRFDVDELRFKYTYKVGNTLGGITPPLPVASGVIEVDIVSATRSSDIVTVITASPHQLSVGNSFFIKDTVGGAYFDGTWQVIEVLSPTSFTYGSTGLDESVTGGIVRFERVGLSTDGSRVLLTSASPSGSVIGPYLWDTEASFVLSSYTAKINTSIDAGTLLLNLEIQEPNNIPNQQGFLIFDYGLETQEGPVRLLYKPSNNSLAIDPSYVFQYPHSVGAGVTMLRRRGANVMSGLGKEFAFYICDPTASRAILQDIIEEIKSVGIFLKYIIRYPELYYATIDVYQSGIDPG